MCEKCDDQLYLPSIAGVWRKGFPEECSWYMHRQARSVVSTCAPAAGPPAASSSSAAADGNGDAAYVKAMQPLQVPSHAICCTALFCSDPFSLLASVVKNLPREYTHFLG